MLLSIASQPCLKVGKTNGGIPYGPFYLQS
jgi:hypothetical protein